MEDRILKTRTASILGAAAALTVAFTASAGDPSAEAMAMIKRDFKSRGIASADRVNQDGVQMLCNHTHNQPPKDIAARLEKDQLAGVQWPADGKLLGDWKAGEQVAQSGRGFTWSDKPGVTGGSCYNCHQIGPNETSFGTVGPSLYQFGKIRGSGADTQKYVYSKIYNAKASNLCSLMPRFGYVGALTEQQIKDLVALLLDPGSPVNK
jgi:sulfur-oxidizing protein SoxX